MIKVNNLSKVYNKKKVLDIDEIEFNVGKIYGVVGPNGSGKTTLLKTMLGLRQKDSGNVLISDTTGENIAKYVSYMSDVNHLTNMSIQSNIEMMKVLYSDIDETILDEILKLIPIDLNVGYNEISKGQLALVRLALCISRKTPVYILDEPFDGLDIIVRRKVIEFLLSYVQFEVKTVVITSHQLEVIEPLIDEVYVIHEGRIQDQIDMQVLREEHNSSLSEYFEEKFKYLYERK